ncbi:hypothetical protein TIFTF001_041163 [Ficus carica]|uniref:Protein kinase domain-containing protein n=1 Tax=Ficus carica TaxID=3494 RepID=A0AA87ZJZ9_FICCA|nr:hypothetical protein TIFTF001_041163 [Ficus carica]
MESRFQCFPGLMKKDKKQRYFLENGGTLLEELVSSCKGRWRCNPIRTYSAKEIEEATDHFESFIKADGFSKWYKGTLEDRPVLIKKYNENGAYRDIACRDIAVEHTDVYSFGIMLCVFLTGRKVFEFYRPENEGSLLEYITELTEIERWMEVVDPKILEGDIGEEQQLQLEAFLELALKCTQRTREDRPLMIDVAKELVRIEKSVSCPSRLA